MAMMSHAVFLTEGWVMTSMRLSGSFQILFAAIVTAATLFTEPTFAARSRERTIHAGDVATYGIVGDSGWPSRETANVRRSLLRSRVHRLIMPGDNLYFPLVTTYEDAWGPWRSQGFEFPIVALGNHVLTYEAEMTYFGMPSEYFTHIEGSSLFIVLNSDNESTVEEQARFLRNALEASLSQFVFVVFHHPPVTISRRHDWREKEHFHNVIRPIVERYRDKVTAIIVGHDHVAGLYELNGIPMIVSGASVEALPTGTARLRQGSVKVETRWVYQGKPSWARMDVVPGQNEVWINFLEIGRERVMCSALISSRPSRLRSNCSQRERRRADHAEAKARSITAGR